MARLLAVSAAIALMGLAIAGSPSALAVPRSSGLSAEFPVGRCIAIDDRMLNDDGNLTLNNSSNLTYQASVPCTDPARDYRVVQHVPEEGKCGPETNNVYYARDVVVLCVVQDRE